MEQILVKNIPDNKLNFFLELVNNLGFSIEMKSKSKKLNKEQKMFIEGLEDSINQVEHHLQGTVKLKTADQLLNEL
jgi:hypothetical protein